MNPRPRRRVLRLVLLIGLLALLAHPAKVVGDTLLLLPTLFPSSPVNLLPRVTAQPRREEFQYAYSTGVVNADIYHPATAGRHGGVILLLGVRPLPRDDPQVVSFAEALARTGIVVLVPESSNLLAGRILPEEQEALRMSFELLASQPDVDPDRLGFLGFSVGGGLSIIAAAQPALRNRVRFVNALGAYDDAEQLLIDVASSSTNLDGRIVPWQPSPLAREVFASAVMEALLDGPEHAELRATLIAGEIFSDSEAAASASPAIRLAQELLAGTSRPAAEAALQQLPASVRDRLRAVSPSTHIANLRARLYLMHDTSDSYVPFGASRRLARSAPPQTLARHTELSIFQHVVPDRPAPWHLFVPDLWRLFWHTDSVLLELD